MREDVFDMPGSANVGKSLTAKGDVTREMLGRRPCLRGRRRTRGRTGKRKSALRHTAHFTCQYTTSDVAHRQHALTDLKSRHGTTASCVCAFGRYSNEHHPSTPPPSVSSGGQGSRYPWNWTDDRYQRPSSCLYAGGPVHISLPLSLTCDAFAHAFSMRCCSGFFRI